MILKDATQVRRGVLRIATPAWALRNEMEKILCAWAGQSEGEGRALGEGVRADRDYAN